MTTAPASPLYTSRIIKASALIGDTRELLLAWDFGQSREENLARARGEKKHAKPTRPRVKDVLAIFRQRYFTEPGVGEALAVLAQAPGQSATVDRLLYFYAARSDRLLHDVVTELLAPMRAQGLLDVTPEDIERQLTLWAGEGKTATMWGEETTARVASGLLATLRDFGVLSGRVRKQIATPPMPVEAFAFVAFVLAQDTRSGARLLSHDEWRLFFLDSQDVERLFLEAHQRQYLAYHAAGSVVRISFPCDTLVDYAHALAG
ncbi:MAG: DUF1819 family protein [Thermomicrobiales bacterium]